MTENKKIRVAVCGACGRMGQEVVKAVKKENDMELVCAIDAIEIEGKILPVDVLKIGEDIGKIIENKEKDNRIISSLRETLLNNKVDVMVEFTNSEAGFGNIKTALECGVRPIVGTTGLTEAQLKEIEKLSQEKNLGVLVAPNFAIGAILMMMFAANASKYFENAEIIELHHNKKKDAPSGTAIKTAQLMSEQRSVFGKDNVSETELLKGARGGVTESNIHIHSVRLPGFVAHQEVIFGAPGQALTIRHDSFDRISFMPGVILSIRHVMSDPKYIYGLENIL